MKPIYLYLFLFSLVINVFQYVNDSRVLKDQQQRIEVLQKKLEKAEKALDKQQPKVVNDTISK